MRKKQTKVHKKPHLQVFMQRKNDWRHALFSLWAIMISFNLSAQTPKYVGTEPPLFNGSSTTAAAVNASPYGINQGSGNSNMLWYTVGMANVAKHSFTITSIPCTASFNSVYSAITTYSGGTGFTTPHTLSTLFQWDRTNNLIVAVCYSLTGIA